MSALFLNIFNLAINASWLIVAVIVARLLLKKAPKWISCLLWGLVALRLICPVSLTSALSLLPSAKVVPENIEEVSDPHIDFGVRIIDNAVNPVIERSFSPDVVSSANPMQVVVSVASFIWLAGVVVMLTHAIISFILLKRKVRTSVTLDGKVMECDEVDSPFILGILRPVIYVPSGINEKTLELVTAHEEAHLKRHDHWWKPLGFVLLAVYWFNPLCWVAYILLCRDIEAACDEKVIRDKDREYMAAYSQALLDCSANRRIIAACPLAFGEMGVKERVKGVLNYKKPAFWVIVVALIVCIVVAVCFMTNPVKKVKMPDVPIVFSVHENPDGYIELHWEEKGLIYVPYMPLDPKLLDDCIGYSEFEDGVRVYICSIKDLSETEWICDSLTETVNGHSELMVYREINVKKVPVGWSSDYDWNIPYTDYVGDAPVVVAIASRLPYPDACRYDHIEIQSETEPYGLTVFLNGDSTTDVEGLKNCADTAFESIGNLGSITFVLIGSDESATYLRSESITEYLISDNGMDQSESVISHDYFPYEDNQIGVSMSVSEVTPTGCIIKVLQADGNVTGDLQTGQWYELQVKNGDGDWIDATVRATLRGWEDIAYMVKKDGVTELALNWEQDYGYLQDGHYRLAKKVMDYRSPGDYDEYEVYAEFDIGDGTASAESVTDWMDITLPRGYSISDFDDAIGYMGGALILPRSYHAEDSEYGPLEWQYSGLISRLPVESGMATVTFDNGIPDPASMPHDNHTESEYVKTIGLERSNTQWSAVMLKENHDLYTASQVGEMENDGVDLTGKDLTSDYWTFWFVKEGEDTYYVLTLSAREFSEKEVEDIASGVIIK